MTGDTSKSNPMTYDQWVIANPAKFKKYREDFNRFSRNRVEIDPARYSSCHAARAAGICLKNVFTTFNPLREDAKDHPWHCRLTAEGDFRQIQTALPVILRSLTFERLSYQIRGSYSYSCLIGALVEDRYFCTLTMALELALETGTSPDLWIWGTREEKETAISNYQNKEISDAGTVNG